MSDRLSYLIECSRAAREEILFRVKHRDTWLKLQLIVQAMLWAISNKIQVGSMASIESVPYVLALSFPVSLVLVSLYIVEDGLIDRLSKYVGSLSDTEQRLSGSDNEIACWDASSFLSGYTKGKVTGLNIRLLAQFTVFFGLPLYLAALSYINETWPVWLMTSQGVIAGAILVIIVMSYHQRRQNQL
ncbi:hypothetical protein [Vibrio quintilis]|uniref:Uncharacterized protein n=1 Tax=Vibrio quintilis TaxID=1117707 RepID=A0A1M7YWV5_9VIBR|nr:hypothetical protein [Vibrio quintilis]SHO56993.1 hypothetical protein VQ7734_02762 [Vibrio quintilis]